jgi:hypothetical protein
VHHPSHSSWFYCSNNIWWREYRSLSSSLCSLLHSPVTSSQVGPNILVRTLFSNTLVVPSFLSVSNQILCPHKTAVKIIVLYVLIFICLDSKLGKKRFCTPTHYLERKSHGSKSLSRISC